MWAIALHGGAGTWEPEAHPGALAGLSAALAAGADLLRGGGSALDAVVRAAVVLEDDPLFNAGTGSTLTLDGRVECDAALMEGRTLRCGAVAAVPEVKNPVLLARKVMEATDHVLLAGEGALALARLWGLAGGNPPTEARRKRWLTARETLGSDPGRARLAALVKAHPELLSRSGTIGAVAVDRHGGSAAATSTGGVLLKLPGRIGDTPLPGAGNYANAAGAASATGHGELMMRSLTTRTACDRLAAGGDAERAAQEALEATGRETGSRDLGLIVVDQRRLIGVAHGTENMPHAFQREGEAPTVRMRVTGTPR